MNLLLVEPHERVADRARITGDRARHAREVLGVVVGRRLRVGVVDGPLGEGEVTAVGSDVVELSLVLEAEAPPRPRLDVVVAIPRPKTLAKLLPEVVSMGVDRLFLLRTWKVEKPYLASALLTPEGWLPLVRAGSMQGRLTHTPHIVVEPLFRPWIEDRAPALFEGADVRWVMHPHAARSSAQVGPVDPEARAVIAIGPEAGLVDFEVERFVAAGFEAVTMGPRPLRVETAVVAAVAQLELLRGLGAVARASSSTSAEPRP